MNKYRDLQSKRAFSLMEMMAVIIIILIMIAVASVSFANSRPSMQVKTDAANMVSFLRNMWDRTKATGNPLVLNPDFEKRHFTYTDPREGKTFPLKFTSDAVILAIKLNDRLYSRRSMNLEEESGSADAEGFTDSSLFLSEGRGLSLVAVIFGIPGEDKDAYGEYSFLTIARLNLVTGKGKVQPIEKEELEQIFTEAEEADNERAAQPIEVPYDSEE